MQRYLNLKILNYILIKTFVYFCKRGAKLVLYQALTGTGKTLSPVGLSGKEYSPAKHIGLHPKCISMEIPIVKAFGCVDPGDIRLHYFTVKDYVPLNQDIFLE